MDADTVAHDWREQVIALKGVVKRYESEVAHLQEEIATLRPLVEWLAMRHVQVYATDQDAFDLKAYVHMPVGKVREARRALGLPPDEIGEPSLSERKER